MLKVGNIYTTSDNSVAHIGRFENGYYHGAIEDMGLVAWDVNGICMSGYNGWDIVGDGSTLQLTYSPKIDERHKRVGKFLTAPAMQVYPGGVAKFAVSPAMFWSRMGYNGPITLVLHATAGGGSAANTFQYFMDASVLKCSHFIVGTDGDVYQCGDIHWAAAANGSCTSTTGYWPTDINGNFCTASIEVFKSDVNNAAWPTDAQYKALIPLVIWICNTLGIPKRQCNSGAGGITTHSIFDPVHRPGNYDPGNFDWNRLYGGINVPSVDTRKFMEQQFWSVWMKGADPRRSGIALMCRDAMLAGKIASCMATSAEIADSNDWGGKPAIFLPLSTGDYATWQNGKGVIFNNRNSPIWQQ